MGKLIIFLFVFAFFIGAVKPEDENSSQPSVLEMILFDLIPEFIAVIHTTLHLLILGPDLAYFADPLIYINLPPGTASELFGLLKEFTKEIEIYVAAVIKCAIYGN
uniref:Secreted protein n=1 Tax=Caenorhabditis tropicalis TaxID=1561998 RepID=A0A1I7V0X3_9PELO